MKPRKLYVYLIVVGIICVVGSVGMSFKHLMDVYDLAGMTGSLCKTNCISRAAAHQRLDRTTTYLQADRIVTIGGAVVALTGTVLYVRANRSQPVH